MNRAAAGKALSPHRPSLATVVEFAGWDMAQIGAGGGGSAEIAGLAVALVLERGQLFGGRDDLRIAERMVGIFEHQDAHDRGDEGYEDDTHGRCSDFLVAWLDPSFRQAVFDPEIRCFPVKGLWPFVDPF